MRRLVLLLLPFVLAGCDSLGFDSIDFGDPYTLSPGIAPELDDEGENLLMTVTYTGGCENHRFSLRSRGSGDNVDLWFEHNDAGDDCEGRVTTNLSAPIPSEALSADRVSVLVPGGLLFVVRDGSD